MSIVRIATACSVIVTLLALFFIATPVQAATYPALCSIFTRELEIDDEGEDVRQLQIVLAAEGHGFLPATGYYGPLTAEAVRKFQLTRGISQTGTVGPVTFSAMRTAWCGDSGNGSGQTTAGNLLFAHVTSGNPYHVYWVSAGMSSCTLDGVSRPTYGIESFTAGSNRSHTVTCTGSQGTLTRSLEHSGSATESTGNPGSPPDWNPQSSNITLKGTFTATHDTVNLDVPTSQAVLSWNVPNALVCTISAAGQASHSVSSSGTLSVRPTQTTAYTLSCSSVASPHSSHYIGIVTVFVKQSSTTGQTTDSNGALFRTPTQWDNGQPGAATSYFRATPATISSGSTSNLSWSTVTGSSCRISGGIYNNTVMEWSGSVVVNPTVTTTYTLVCVNAFSQAESYRSTVTVTVGTAGGNGSPGVLCIADGYAYPSGTALGSCSLRILLLRAGSCSPSEQPMYTCTNGRWISPTGVDFCTLYGC